MAYENDDLLHRVDRTYLGPPGYTFPVKIRYVAYGLGVCTFLASTIIVRGVLSIPWGSQSTILILATTVFVTSRLMGFVNGDVTVRSVVKAAWNDLIAPRPPRTAEPVAMASLPHHRLRHRHPAEEGRDER